MDILDIIAAKKLATKETRELVNTANETLENTQSIVSDAQKALEDVQNVIGDAQTAVNDATEAVNKVTEIEQAAESAAQKAEAAAAEFDQMQADILTAAGNIVDEAVEIKVEELIGDVKQEINDNKIDVSIENIDTDNAKSQEITITKQSGTTKYTIKNYKEAGINEDGTMTQKAIKEYVDNTKTYLEGKIEAGGSTNLGTQNNGKIVIVANNGSIEAGSITQDELIRMQLIIGSFEAKNSVGIEIDYSNKTCYRTQDAIGLNAGEDFNQFNMYGGRRRCVVDDKGKIIAFHGELNYIEDGSKGQVMVYQPKFYYLRIPIKTTSTKFGAAITKENIILSDKKQAGFNLHPLFIDNEGNELEYVLMPAYEGCAYRVNSKAYVLDDAQDINFNTDYLSSIIGAKPISGAEQNFTLENAKKLASNRGVGWQLTDLKFESANQMLMIVEYNNLNLQEALGKGVSELTNQAGINTAAITGSTSYLGSKSGEAETTYSEGIAYNTPGTLAISYRGLENPWGNIWHFVNNVKVIGTGANNGGNVIIDGKQLAYSLPDRSGWISCFGHDANMSWAMIPSVIPNSPNSILPIGDYLYTAPSLNGTNFCAIGGKNSAKENNGPFYYTMDADINTHSYSCSAKMMYIPTANSDIYTENYTKWLNKIGG